VPFGEVCFIGLILVPFTVTMSRKHSGTQTTQTVLWALPANRRIFVREHAALTASLANLEAKTTNQFVVVTLKSLQGKTIEDYGYQVGRQWQIGQKDKNSGVLLIVAVAERAVRIEVGYGLEGTLTDALAKVIIENAIVPAFRTGNFVGGIKSGADEIINALRNEAGNAANGANRASAPTASDAPLPIWLVVVLGGGASHF
jgi:uncharacterized protein